MPFSLIVNYENFNKPIEACLDVYNFAAGLSTDESRSAAAGGRGAARRFASPNSTMATYLFNLEVDAFIYFYVFCATEDLISSYSNPAMSKIFLTSKAQNIW